MIDVVVLGSANMDLVAGLSELPPPGSTVLADGLSEYAGGKGANQAVAAARLGASVAFAGAVGSDDRGARLRAALNAAGIDTTELRIAEAPTGVALILVDSRGENVIVVAPGANMTLGPADAERAAALLRPGAVLLCQLEIPVPVVSAASAAARARGALVILNAAPAPARDAAAGLLRDTDILIVNASEAGLILGRDVMTPEDGRAAAAELSRQVPAAALTLGADGAVVADKDGVTWVDPVPVKAVDTVGAGDAFAGALAARLASGSTLREAAATGAAAGALAACRPGAQDSLPSQAEVDALMANRARDGGASAGVPCGTDGGARASRLRAAQPSIARAPGCGRSHGHRADR